MDLQKRTDMLTAAKKQLSDKSSKTKLHKEGKLSAYELMKLLFDDGSFVETNAYVKAYVDEIGSSEPAEYEGVVCGYGAIDGRLVFTYCQDASRANGAFSKAAAEKIAGIYDLALKNGAPVVSIYDSLGAKITEGIDVLAGYGKVMKKSASVKGKIPQVALVLGNACGATSIIASMSDVAIVCEGASFSQHPANVLVEAGADKAIGTAKFVAEQGFVADYTETPENAVVEAKKILSYLPSNRFDKNYYAGTTDDANRATPEIASIVSKADYDVHSVIGMIADNSTYKELYSFKSKSLVTAFAYINGIPCGIVANNPSVKEGKLSDAALDKAAGFVKLCDSFGISVLTLVGTKGFDEMCESHGGKICRNAAALANAYASATVPVVTVNIGEAYGTSYAVMGSKAIGADMVFALDSAKIAVLKPSSSVLMMWNEKLAGSKAPIEKRKALEEDWELYMSTPILAANAGQIDDIIPSEQLRARIAAALEMLSLKSEFIKL